MQLNPTQINKNENNFDLLRFIAASIVIFSHAYALFGLNEPSIGGVTFGSLGVYIFFIISGFLITKSWEKNPELFQFVWHRFLRIFPGLICVVLFSIFIIGPLNTTYNLKNYFSSSITWNYLKIILIFPSSDILPGVFLENPGGPSVNGSLWSLLYEIICYFILILFGLCGLFKKKHLLIIYIMINVVVNLYIYWNTPNNGYLLFFYLLTTLSIYFFMGSLISLIIQKFDIKKSLLPISVLLIIFSFTTIFRWTLFFTLPFFILGIASLKSKISNNFGKRGDFSYGLYIYSYPIQQTIISFLFNSINILQFFFISYILTFLLSIISWKFIEAKFLELKHILIKQQIFKFINGMKQIIKK